MTKHESVFLIIINLIHLAQFDTNNILTALNIVTKYMQTHYMHFCTDMNIHIHTHIQLVSY